MNLNMWMIANRLSALEPELYIPDAAPADLQSARGAYATKCAYVYQKGKNVICDGGEEGGYIVFRDMECAQIFEMVQFTFDFYREWQEMLAEAAEQLDYRKIIDKSWTVFHNPMMLLDASNNVLAMSEQYGEDEVNYDWQYLCRHGHSAVSVIQFLMEEGKKHGYYMNGCAEIYHFRNPEINGNQLSAAIYYHNEVCGRINVVEKDRPLNPGDVSLLNYLVKYLSVILGKLNERRATSGALYPVFSKMMLNQPVTPVELQYWKDYTKWSEEDSMRIVVLKFTGPQPELHNIILICNLLQSSIRNCIAAQVESGISFSLMDSQESDPGVRKMLRDMVDRFGLKAGVSLSVCGTDRLHYYYRQAQAAVHYGSLFEPEKSIYQFYDYAIDYMIASGSLEEAVCACQPDIKAMWVHGELNGGDRVETLRAYLQNERSLINTANELYLHRNTLVYRLKKITDSLKYNIDEVYTRDYMKMSIRVMLLETLEKKGVSREGVIL